MNFFENAYYSIFGNKTDQKLIENNLNNKKYLVLNIEDKISSKIFNDLLYYLIDEQVEFITIDINFNNLLDSENLEEIKNFIITRNEITGICLLENKKGISFNSSRFSHDKNLWKNFLYLSTNYPLIYSHYLKDIMISNIFAFSPDKIGFITKKNYITDYNNLDLLFQFDKKYLFSAPFLIYSNEKQWDINKINLTLLTLNYKNNSLYYDQKGKIGYRHQIPLPKKPVYYNFKEWNNAFQSRINSINMIEELSLFKSTNTNFQLYDDEKQIINTIYNFDQLKDRTANTLLTSSKNEALIWKGFKASNQPLVNKAGVFIVQNTDYSWVSDFIFQKNILTNGLNLKRIPISLQIVYTLLLFFIIIYFRQRLIKKQILSLIFILVIFAVNLLLYYIARIIFKSDYPFLAVIIVLIYSFIIAELIFYFNNRIWFNQITSIYKGSISMSFAKDITDFWRQKKWNLDSKAYLCTFMHIDTSAFLKNEVTEDDVDIISAKFKEIEDKIKNNHGVRNNFNPTQILAYFGNPPIYPDHSYNAIKTAYDINNISITTASPTDKLYIALHSQEEWFKYSLQDHQRCYTYFGNSIYILSCMIQYAKKFNIPIIITDSVYKFCGLKLSVRMLDRIKISGMKNTFRLFELIPENIYKNNYQFYDYFHAGLKLFELKKWNESAAYFRQCLKINNEDLPSKIFIDRCKDYVYVPPAPEWDGIFELEKKL